jgi:hypothetical protein
MKQTAVEFLHSEYKRIFGDTMVDIQIGFKISDVFKQAKEMEKEQIIEAFDKGDVSIYGVEINGQQYYNETFKNK